MDRHDIALKKLAEGTAIPAIPLALTAERHMDERYQRALIRYYLDAGVGGIAAAVHTTQFAIRRPEIGLFEPVLRLVSEEVERFEKKTGRTIVKISGVCGPEKQAVSEAKTAKSLGYDAILLSPGGLSDLSEDDLLHRTAAVAEILPVVGFYLQRAVGGRRLSFDYWKQMCSIKNVAAIKCASFNRYETLETVRAVATSPRADEIALYTGNDDHLVLDLLTKYRFEENGVTYEKGFVGGLLGHWAVWTNTAVRLFNVLKKAAAGETVSAELLTVAMQVTDANSAFFDVANDFKGCIAGIHEVLRRQGLMKGIWCLDPCETLSPGQKEEIDRVYRMYPHLSDDNFVKKNLPGWLDENA